MTRLMPRPQPADAILAGLLEGNRRFVEGTRRPPRGFHRGLGTSRPDAIVLGCSDARVPLEHIFDQEPGALFVVRVAGNVVASSQIGSVEFAAARFGCRLALVLGHTRCGAVDATLRWIRGGEPPDSDGLRNIVERIRPHLDPLLRVGRGVAPDVLWDEAVRANVLASVDRLWHGSRLLEQRVRDGKIRIEGALYDLDSGRVTPVSGAGTRGVKRRRRRVRASRS